MSIFGCFGMRDVSLVSVYTARLLLHWMRCTFVSWDYTGTVDTHPNAINQPTHFLCLEVLRILLRLPGERISEQKSPRYLNSVFISAQTLWLLRQMSAKPWVTSHFLSPRNSSYALKIELKTCPTLAGCQMDRVTECTMEMRNWQSYILLLGLYCVHVHAE